MIVAICALVSAVALRTTFESVREIAPLTRRSVMPNGMVPALARALRPNYPYSVIPGGAYSPAAGVFAVFLTFAVPVGLGALSAFGAVRITETLAVSPPLTVAGARPLPMPLTRTVTAYRPAGTSESIGRG